MAVTSNTVLIDSSFLIALYNLRDPYHREVREFIKLDKSPRLIPNVVLAEAAYMLLSTSGQRAVFTFMDALVAANVPLEALTIPDLQRAREIMGEYASARFDFVDVCIMALAERLNITRICTFDHRDFSIFRPKHCEYLELLP